jgi:hypothetical protein
MKHKKPYQLAVEQQTLVLTPVGVSTLLSTEEMSREFMALASATQKNSWALLLDLRQWQPSPQPVFEVLKQLVSWSFANRLQQVDMIQPNDTILLWQYLKATDVPRPEHVVKKIHDDEATARLSLQAAGYLNCSDGD